MSLTDLSIRKAKPSERTQKLRDGSGLYLLLRPDGAKWWRWDYRRPGTGRRNTLSLGTYPKVSLAQARERHSDLCRQLAAGIDPGEQRKSERDETRSRAESTFGVIANELFEIRSKKLTAKSMYSERGLYRLHIEPYLGTRPIDSISARDLLAVYEIIQRYGRINTAHRARELTSRVFRHAIVTERAQRNPAADLAGALGRVEKGHFASITDPARVGALLRALSGYSGSPMVRAALQLAPLVFVRPGELRQARWEDIDLDAGMWRFVASKTRQAHVVPLSVQAVEIFRWLQPLTGRGELVFPGYGKKGLPISESTLSHALRALGYDRGVMSIHGFRAMARTLLDEVLGFRPDFIEHQLAHAVRDPNGRAYNRTSHLPERVKMMQVWADYLDGLKASP
ncbi:tyrosine-type recombinase/integrase [Stenotrophomonas muris]|uniref:tyrosine-type recombinase/integrase n=1 Tax=Stenotrophomonas muris TaxID=2963283 RepID=UPI003F7D3A6C